MVQFVSVRCMDLRGRAAIPKGRHSERLHGSIPTVTLGFRQIGYRNRQWRNSGPSEWRPLPRRRALTSTDELGKRKQSCWNPFYVISMRLRTSLDQRIKKAIIIDRRFYWTDIWDSFGPTVNSDNISLDLRCVIASQFTLSTVRYPEGPLSRNRLVLTRIA